MSMHAIYTFHELIGYLCEVSLSLSIWRHANGVENDTVSAFATKTAAYASFVLGLLFLLIWDEGVGVPAHPGSVFDEAFVVVLNFPSGLSYLF